MAPLSDHLRLKVESLSEDQRKCLRLVYRHKTSKEIARTLGNITSDGVDARIKAAMRTLGVNERREAAELVALAEGLYQPLVDQPLDIAARHSDAPPPIPRERRDKPASVVREQQRAFTLDTAQPSPVLPLPLPRGGRQSNELSTLQRLAWIAAIMVGIILSFGIFVAGMEALSRFARP